MTVRWELRWKAKFFWVAYPLMFLLAGILQAAKGRPMWGMLGIGALMSVPIIWLMGKQSFPRAIGFDGRRVTIDRDQWNLEDVDSVAIGPESVRVILYRPGTAGTEFAASCKEMDEETWRQVLECCGRIEKAMRQGTLDQRRF